MSMEHTRSTIDKMMPDIGEAFLTNKRRPILTIIEDTTPGVHDTLNAACDVHRYHLLGHEGYHDNCTDNLAAALQAIGKSAGGRTSSFRPRRQPYFPSGDGLHRRAVRLPSGYEPDKRRHAERRSLHCSGLTQLRITPSRPACRCFGCGIALRALPGHSRARRAHAAAASVRPS